MHKRNKEILILAGTFIILSAIQHFIYKYTFSKDSKEGMENENVVGTSSDRNVYLIGDSIIKNDSYVTSGMSVENHINKLVGLNMNKQRMRTTVINLSIDNSFINDIYDQLRFIPQCSRNSRNFIILSVGGNDILKKYVYTYNTNVVGLKTLFNKYKELVERIQTQFPEPQYKLVIMNIYYPPDKETFSPFYAHIKEWNNRIDDYIVKHNKNIGLIRIDEKITEKDDFVNKIEPSETGGEKIAREISEFLLL